MKIYTENRKPLPLSEYKGIQIIELYLEKNEL
jgi:hypothetical protein